MTVPAKINTSEFEKIIFGFLFIISTRIRTLQKLKLSTIWEKANGIFRTFFIIHEHSFSRDCSRECSANTLVI